MNTRGLPRVVRWRGAAMHLGAGQKERVERNEGVGGATGSPGDVSRWQGPAAVMMGLSLRTKLDAIGAEVST